MAAKAMKAGLEVLRPLLSAADVKPIGTVLIGTVHKDLHDIGKNLVGMMMEGGGLKVIDLGVDVPPDRFLAAAHEHKPDVIGLSALLTTTMPNMRKTVELLRGVGYNGRIIVGGAPVNAAFAEAIGADGYADDAPGAVRLARQLIVAAER
jgi:5-methyltetrahydrofolate--homocysteine methyltransferase